MEQDESTAARHQRCIALLARMEGFEGSELAKSGVEAWDYYLQRPRGDEVEGRSQAVSGDVSAMVESALSQVTEALSTENLAEFEGTNDDDEKQAQLEGATLTCYLMRGPGWLRLASCIKELLLLRRGVARLEVVSREESSVVAVEGVGRIAKFMMEFRGVEFVSWDSDTKLARIIQKEKRQELNLVHVPAENFLYVQWPLDDFSNIPACAERHTGTRQQLIDDEGISEEKAREVPKLVSSKSDETAHALKGYIDTTGGVSDLQERIEWFSVYYLHEGQRYRAIAANAKVLDEAPVSKTPPFGVGVPFINPGHLEGFSFYDKLKGVQDQSTANLRMLNDNAEAVTTNRIAVLENSANNDQLTDQDPSGVIQFRRSAVGGDIRNGVMPIQTQPLTADLVAALQFQKANRSEMAGASLDVGTGKVQLPDRMGSMGLDRAYSASEQLSQLILKTIAQTFIKSVWLIGHELLRTEWVGELSVKYQGRWLSQKPATWPRRYDCTIKPGMSPGERQRRSNALGVMIGGMERLAEKGMEGILVDAERYYRAWCDWARLNDIQRPEQYLIDPASDGAKQAMQRKQQAAEAEAQASKQLQKTALALEQMGHAVKKYGIDVNAAVEKYKTDSETDRTEASLTVDLVKEREKGERELAKPAMPAAAESDGKSDDK